MKQGVITSPLRIFGAHWYPSLITIIILLRLIRSPSSVLVQGLARFGAVAPKRHGPRFNSVFLSRLYSTSHKTTMSLTNHPVVHAPASLLPKWMLPERTKCLTSPDIGVPSPSKTNKQQHVVYWMHRDMRTVDNWALLWSASLARQWNVPLTVVYALPPPPQSVDEDHSLPPTLAQLPMTARHGDFLLGGLQHVHTELQQLGIPFHVLLPSSYDTVGQTVVDFCQGKDKDAKSLLLALVVDFSPLRHAREWMELQAAPLLQAARIPLYQVDAHNIVPVWIAGEGRRQIGARTLRPRIHRVLNKYLTDFPTLSEVYREKGGATSKNDDLPSFDRATYESYLHWDESVPSVDWAIPGTHAGMDQYESFVRQGLKTYDTGRNDPTQRNICSNLSAWTNHGHISFQRITLLIKQLKKYAEGSSSFVEEGVIRRELSDNFCYYTPNDYDALTAALDWAQDTLQVHACDKRDWLYTLQQLEQARTHDDLWNAAQLQLVHEGQMHGFLRMYWAKKILEWTVSPEFALRAAQYLNDKFALDGKDPNGFVGVGWSIMGIHDQGWKEREVFGKIRFMNYNGCKRKFNVAQFVALYPDAARHAAQAARQGTLGGSSNSKSTTTTKSKPSKPKRTVQSTIPATLRKKLKKT